MNLDWQTGYRRYRRYFVDIGQIYRQKRVRVYTEVVLSFVTISFFLFFAIKPTATTITGLLKTIKDQKLVSQKLEEKISALSQAEKNFTANEDDLPLVSQTLPSDPAISILIKEIEALAYRSGIAIQAIQFSQMPLVTQAKEEKEKTISFTLSANGDYQNLKSFLNALDSLRRIILIDSFGFRSGRTEKDSLSLSLTANAYYLPEGKLLTKTNE